MKKNTDKNIAFLVTGFLAIVTVLLFTNACSPQKSDNGWSSLPDIQIEPALQGLQPVWQNESDNGAVEVMAFIESYCRSSVCLSYNHEILPYLASDSSVRLSLYDYPLSQEAKSFMLSAAGICVARSDPSLYLDFLDGAARLSDRYDNNLEIQYLVKELLGEYDRQCIRSATKQVKGLFENNNPLGLQEVPATIIEGKVIYGNISLHLIKSYLASMSE